MTEPRPPRRDQTPPAPRQGPRPLALHLTAAQSLWLTSLAALPLSRSGLPDWKPDGPLCALLAEVESHDAERFAASVSREVRARFDTLLTGLERYRHHPYRRDLADPPTLWCEGATRLLDYGQGGSAGRPVLFVPSLVNRGYVLDLSARRSLLRWLAQSGIRPLLVEWGWPGDIERRFTLTDYIAGRLERALDAAVAAAGGPLPVVGYCMGGQLVAALAQRRPHDVSAIALMATPWDFHGDAPAEAERLAASMAPFLPLVAEWGELPVDGIQALFTALDPLLAVKKFSAFARLDPASDRAEAFVALEDWLNDGVPLAAPVAIECLSGWYGENTPARGEWRIAGEPVDPGRLDVPSLHLIPSRDRIVPPASARALADAIAGARRIEPTLGHIGMVVGGRAPRQIWKPLADWLTAPD